MHKTHHLSSRVAGALFIFLLIIFAGKSSLAAGWVDVNIGVNISQSTVTVGKNFDVSFSLKEYRGESKTFEYVQNGYKMKMEMIYMMPRYGIMYLFHPISRKISLQQPLLILHEEGDLEPIVQ